MVAQLAIIEDASAKIEMKPVETPKNGAFYAIGVHDDAGVALAATPDAGARDAGPIKR